MAKKQEKELTPQQDQVISLMLAGQTQREVAQAAGVAPETISRWRSGHAVFVATLNQRRHELWRGQRERLANLAGEAVGTLKDLMKSESDSIRLRAAVAVLRTQAEPPGETDPDRLQRKWEQDAVFERLLDF